MKTTFAALAFAAALAAPVAGLATERGYNADVEAQVRAMLVQKGYDVRKIDFEDGYYEAYAIKDGQRMEITVTADLQIVNGPAEQNESN